jgi:hypothetical protein
MKTNFNDLDNIDKSNPFRVPDNYFAQFNEDIMYKLPVKNKPVIQAKKITLWSKARPWVYAAALFALMFVGIQFYKYSVNTRINSKHATSSQSLMSNGNIDKYWSTVNISEDEFYQYLENQLTEDNYYDFMYNQIYSDTSM